MENILKLLGKIKRLEKAQLTEPDPRARLEKAEEIDRLNICLEFEARELVREVRELRQQKKAS